MYMQRQIYKWNFHKNNKMHLNYIDKEKMYSLQAQEELEKRS